MHLKLRRSQKPSLTGNPIFILDVMAELTEEESGLVKKYKLQKEQVYWSAKAQENQAHSQGALGGLASFVADRALKRIFTLGDLVNGQHIECKDLAELVAAEAQVHEACQNLRRYLDIARSFDGSEVVVEVVAA